MTGEQLRRLDALVAEHIFGCKVLWQNATVSGPYCGCNCENSFQEGPHSNPDRMDANLRYYSSEIQDAWLVVEKLKHLNPMLVYVPTSDCWSCSFLKRTGTEVAADTAPLAICLAALKAKGITP